MENLFKMAASEVFQKSGVSQHYQLRINFTLISKICDRLISVVCAAASLIIYPDQWGRFRRKKFLSYFWVLRRVAQFGVWLATVFQFISLQFWREISIMTMMVVIMMLIIMICVLCLLSEDLHSLTTVYCMNYHHQLTLHLPNRLSVRDPAAFHHCFFHLSVISDISTSPSRPSTIKTVTQFPPNL